MTTRKKAETVQEFLARGGKVNIIPPTVREEETHTMPIKTKIDFDSLSLGDSEFLFGETRTRKTKKTQKRVSAEDFSKLVEASNLPASVMEALKNAVRK
jgi:hypothetical protein